MATHAASEAALRESGVAFTSLRNGYYAASALWLLGDALETGELRAPEDGPVSWTTHPDLTEATAIALTDEGLHESIVALTASEVVDLAGIAEIASELAGRLVHRVVVPDDEYRAGLIAGGMPEERADVSMGLFVASRQGEFARVDPTLARLIGRAPTPLRDVLKATISPAE